MSADYTPASVVAALSAIAKQIDEKAAEIADLDRAAVLERQAFKKAYARAFLSSDGAMDVRRYKAEEDTADLALSAELAEQVLRAGREALRVLRDRLEVGRSVGSILKMEWAS
jgi:stage V sporulation protein SpoVS